MTLYCIRNNPFFFLRRSYPDLNHPFRTLDRKQTFLLKGLIHPIEGTCACASGTAGDGCDAICDKWFIYRGRMRCGTSAGVKTIDPGKHRPFSNKETSSIQQQAGAVTGPRGRFPEMLGVGSRDRSVGWGNSTPHIGTI